MSNYIHYNLWDAINWSIQLQRLRRYNSILHFADLVQYSNNINIVNWKPSLYQGIKTGSGGFVVQMHEDACETGSQIPRALARGIWPTVRTSPNALGQQTPTDRP